MDSQEFGFDRYRTSTRHKNGNVKKVGWIFDSVDLGIN